MRKISLIITLLCLSCLVNASEFMFKHLEVKDGLSNNQVLDIFKDSEGFMWFATASGLNRYDGYQVTAFRSYDTDPTSLPDNYTKSIQEDNKGNLWILTGEGYAIYHPESETFNRDVRAWMWEIGIDGSPALVYIDHNKNMWFYVEGKGCYLYIPESQLLYPLLFDAQQLPAGEITDIAECQEGVLLIYNTGRLVCLDIHTNKIKWQQEDLTKELRADEYGVFTLFVDSDDDVWIYSPFGMWVYNPEQKKWQSHLCNIIKRQSHNMVRAVAQDKQGCIWIGKDQDGIDILDKETGEVRQLRNKPGDERSLQNNTVMVLYEDSNENIWVGTYKKGVSYFNESTFKFGIEHIGDINCIEEDKDGRVWLGTNDAGIIYWNSVTGEQTAFPQNSQTNMATDAIVCLMKASDGKLWIGTFWGGLICYDNGRITHYKNVPGQPNSLVHNNVWSLAEDRAGNIWIGTLGGGVQSLNPKTGLFTTYNVNSTGLISDYVSSLCLAKDGTLWIGTAQGLSKLNTETKKIINLTGAKSGSEHFSNQNINQVFEDSRGLIWIGTREGLNVYNPKMDELTILGIDQGLSSTIISGIVEDDNKNIWVTTARGITNIVPAVDSKTGRYTFRNYIYDDKDGLQNSEFNQRSIKNLSTGEILMGGLYGINRFRPDDIKYNKILPKVIFTQFMLFNDEVKIGKEYGGRVILNKALNRVDQIELSYEQNIFSILFASDNHILPEKMKYAYKLEGFNDEWLTTTYGKVTYTNLASGTYVLKVKAINSDGYSGDEEATLKIVIHPPFWLSIWAYIIYGLLVVAALILARHLVLRGERNKFKMQQMKQEAEKNQEITDMKLKFFTNISHELRTPLTLIISPLETLMKEYQSDDVLVDKLNMVQRNATRLLNLVNQLLDFRKSDVSGHHLSLSDGDIISYINNICTSFTSLSEKKDVHLTFYSAVPSLNMSFDEDKIGKVMMNLLSNAFKFTHDGGRVDVAVDLIKDQVNQEILEIKVADTGIGISEEDKERIFERFYQVDNPGIDISGSGVGLNIVRDFVTLHGGTVRVMDNAPTGCVFVVHIPVKRSGSKLEETEPEKESMVENSPVVFSTLEQPELHMEPEPEEEPEEEKNHIITIEGLEEEIRRMEAGGDPEALDEEPNLEAVTAIGPQRATVIQLIEGEDNQIITHVIPPTELPEVETSVSKGKKSVMPISLAAKDLIGGKKPAVSVNDKHPLVLVVDDNDDFLTFMYDSLSKNYQVKLAANGREAWELIPELMPDIIVSDVMMPEMDGNELCRLVKGDKRTAGIPFILLTARQSNEYKLEGLTLGADDYITKPFNMDILGLRIRKLLDLKAARNRSRIDPEPSEITITSMDEKLIDHAVKYVEDNISRSDLSVEELSHELGMSRVHLYKKLLAITGKTPIEFIRVIRLKRAAQLLRESQQNVSEIAYQVGFNNPKYFSKYFKEEFGMLPSAYQDREGR